MTNLELLIHQNANAYDWTNKLVETIPFYKWEIIPGTVASSISWQVGHLIISHYFHSIMVIRGHQMDILRQLPVKDYSDLFTVAPADQSTGKFTAEKLFADLKTMQQKSLDILATVTEEELQNPLEPTPTPHPIAKTKFEAIDWNMKHTMYHCGQIGILRRIVDRRFDFGLRVV
ncbi:DinB family protein [Dyadobacter sp. CY261]|uniref:DinB family protein n=1 Tax=Dyadobacter sp. CY261 TaxID=2907203 RepID=UPI001F185A3B|nr:DinB family protein [Dyadobacter sp. CY261]MCF0074356.1 DinB family protein [Dyadobacter sp. CY261]